MVRLVVEDMPRNDHHHHESGDEKQRLPHVAGDQRERSEDDGRDAPDGGGREADDQPRHGGSHAHDEQNDEEYRQAHGREERQHADEPRRKTHYRPDVPDHAVDERAHLAFGLLLARNPHQQPAQQGQHQPEVVPARVLEIEDCAPDGERRQYGGVAPCQQRTARVADHAAAGVFDHAADQRQAFGGFEFTVFHCVIGFPKLLRRRV